MFTLIDQLRDESIVLNVLWLNLSRNWAKIKANACNVCHRVRQWERESLLILTAQWGKREFLWCAQFIVLFTAINILWNGAWFFILFICSQYISAVNQLLACDVFSRIQLELACLIKWQQAPPKSIHVYQSTAFLIYLYDKYCFSMRYRVIVHLVIDSNHLFLILNSNIHFQNKENMQMVGPCIR